MGGEICNKETRGTKERETPITSGGERLSAPLAYAYIYIYFTTRWWTRRVQHMPDWVSIKKKKRARYKMPPINQAL